ncbi:glycoside hydrolase family 15 protein [Dictyobacter arantiisoli]|uniref:Trehalase n=1 Tax=Dictyobacter arantiisoli TaxID=2014874 RepID=A0A5A5TJ25_9CHLR|nr:glycoside hydrolase family 15 protein [Dictyobacter arantiisoli]GCF10999.1 glucoamylase [Dictyobacter arantiisoli]
MVGMNELNRTYLPINSYGVIGDCHSAVLVSPDGSVDWGCLPDFDSPAIFCRLLDAEQGGYFQIAPTEGNIPGSQRYLRGSNVLQTRFASIAGEVVLTDFMPVETLSAWPYQAMNNNTWTREDGSCHCMVRIVECVHGEMSVTMRLKVTPNYAADASKIELNAQHLGALITSEQQNVALAIVGASLLPSYSMHVEQNELPKHASVVAQVTLREGERLLFAVGMGRTARSARRLVEEELPTRNFDAELAHTLHAWRTWIAGSNYQGPYADKVERSALALKLMTYAPTGAIVAAPTTSLPEHLGGVRNWDYRFTWLRDATFTLYAFNVLGFTEEARAFTHWLRRLSYANGEDLQIMYGIRGERDLTEKELYHLSGYGGSRPVRVGNGAAEQKQMDVFGEVLDCIHMYRRQGSFERYGETLDGPLWSMMRMLVDYVCEHWQEPDSGIWEVRGGLRHFVYSKVMCWVALDRGIRAAEQMALEADLPRWIAIRDQIRADILINGYDTNLGAFTQSYGNGSLDASNLLLPLVGFISPNDPRMRSTVDRIIENLTDEHGFVYRYLSDDGLEGEEGTFAICTFWLVDNLAMQGRVDEARSLFERLASYAGRLGLFSEEIDARNNAALGNYPQAFTHIALINSANNLRKAEIRMAEHHTDPVIAAIRLQKQP